MYRVSPLTYLVAGMLSSGLHGRPVTCARNELSVLDPPQGQTCGEYLEAYLTAATGQLLNPAATEGCRYCPLSNADQFLASLGMTWDTRWRNLGLIWAYIGFNIGVTFWLYWSFRVRKRKLSFNVKSVIRKLSKSGEKGTERGKISGEDGEGNDSDEERLKTMRSHDRRIQVQPRAY